MRVAVLGVGTELVDGQIVNKNSPWISAKLKDLGLTTALHLAVPDDRKVILESLEFCAGKSDWLFVTGGLGPTTDDFTRDLISEWSGKKLIFDEASWQHIQDRMLPRGFAVKEVQKQQCYFPEGAHVLKNVQGTANGFFLEAKGKKVFVLPGPPREIEAIWDDHIADWLIDNTKEIDPYLTRKWDTMGLGESDVAVIVEEILKDVKVEIGYRVHLPYVEVKISYFKSQEKEFQKWVDAVTEGLAQNIILRDGDEAPQLFADSVQNIHSLSLCDQVTGTFLINRIVPVMRDYMDNGDWTFSNSEGNEFADVQLNIWTRDEHSCFVSLEQQGRKTVDIIEAPMKSVSMHERRLQYFAEMALIFWIRNLVR